MGEAVENLYVHFPFCRRKCTYCALHSRAGSKEPERRGYVESIAKAIGEAPDAWKRDFSFSTVYFGGGTPALCDLKPVAKAIAPLLDKSAATEFTVELNPLDVNEDKLSELADMGVNRISMGVESLDEATLRHMGRGYTLAEAEKAFALVKKRFDNSGIDLIAGYPGDKLERRALSRLGGWGLRHFSAYSLILEEGSILKRLFDKGSVSLPADDETMDEISMIADFLESIGLERYEISNYAVPGFECRHNLAVWRGEDYLGVGEGAHGRIGLVRTRDWMGPGSGETESVDAVHDRKERRIFSLRTSYGLDPAGFPEWEKPLDGFASAGLLSKVGGVYRLTARGCEVCDSILAEIV